MTVHKYGWKKDKRDDRDLKFSAPRFLVSLPPRADLRPHCSPVEDQDEGSCTGQTFSGILEYYDRVDDGAHADVSRLFIYYCERELEGTVEEDSGAYLRDGIKALAVWGAPDEYLWPYVRGKWAVRPSAAAYNDAIKRRILKYYRAMSIHDIKSAIAAGFPVAFGAEIYESFESRETTRTGIVPMPEANERILGGHAMGFFGYDDEKEWFITRNSWGEKSGDKGYYFIPYKYVSKYAADFWIILKDGLPTRNEQPVISLPEGTVWYIPIIGIVQYVWEWLKGKKRSQPFIPRR